MTAEKVRESASANGGASGVPVQKSRRRDPRAFDFGGYMVIEPSRNVVLCGGSPERLLGYVG